MVVVAEVVVSGGDNGCGCNGYGQLAMVNWGRSRLLRKVLYFMVTPRVTPIGKIEADFCTRNSVLNGI